MRHILNVLCLVAIVSAQGYGTSASINNGPATGPYGTPYGIQPSYNQPQQQFYVPSSGPAHDSRPDSLSQLFQNQNQQNSIVSPPQQSQQQSTFGQQPALINQQPLISTVSHHPSNQQQQQQQAPSSYYGVPSGPFQTGFAGYPSYPTGYGTVQTMNNPYVMYGQPFDWNRGTMITSQLTQGPAPAPHGQNTQPQERNQPRNEIAAVGYGPAASSVQPASQAYGNPYGYGTQYHQQFINGPSARAPNAMERIDHETATTTSSPPVLVTSHPTPATESPVHETSGPAQQVVDPWATIASTVNGVTNKKASEIQRTKKDH